MDDSSFVDHVADELAALSGVLAVSLGGSRASASHGPGSDWDFALYYRDRFDPDNLRALGWEGTISEIGGWGGGVFNGGAWLEIDGRRVDVHYRDLKVVEHELGEARRGRFHIEPLMFHLAGIPSYLVVAEIAINRVLRGDMPRPEYPQRLQETAPPIWRERAAMTLHYARAAYVGSGKLTAVAGAVATSAMMTAHAVLAARGEWVTNEKRLLERAGLRDIDQLVAGLRADSRVLDQVIDEAESRFAEALTDAIR
ncbi:nucleotidyltransferase domain-containing protein [Arthrobacter sp. ISL-28]|uniref:nucleotidyltransferase domain-containing protein n=1 Tax=Arthrobacter sp. ISL-28 TaxID=2819108 RepID=UPI001BE7B9E8|nr:nucleotidyltransferase domain-containing protein [Arthrobacter sp. ISL-28]MBT2522006.1 nucleotidyltransferase domain-containing protein [Arthrobacter sp. ISL-28]